MESIAILLSTYNGERFLREQLNSLFNQTNQDFHLFVRDDLSSDNTLSILEEFVSQHPSRITLIPNDGVNLGAAQSYICLLNKADAPYYMFCDQDDIWLPNKIEQTFSKMREQEQSSGTETPISVFTNAKIVDHDLKESGKDFFSIIGYKKFKKNNKFICVHNIVMGASMLFNQAAKKIAFPVSPYIHMHDEWIALSIFFKQGTLLPIETPTILYRQHDYNVIGTRKDKLFSKRWLTLFTKKINLNHKTFGLPIIKFVYYKLRFLI